MDRQLLLKKPIKSTVIVNGSITQWFGVVCGCRQGNPISPYLFVVCVNILAIRFEKTKGIWINKVEHIISQFPDDTQQTNTED